jgi:Transposase DDE domain
MATIPQVAGVLREVLGPVAERAARATGFVRRASKLTGARFVQTLVFGWLARPEARLSELAQTAAALGVPISPQALDERFGAASADCLREVLEAAVRVALGADPVAVPLLRRFAAVAVQDCTTIALPDALAAAWPGCGGGPAGEGAAAMKLGVRLDLASGRLGGPYVEAGRTDDRAALATAEPLPPGALRVADLGFFRLDTLAAQDAQGVYWLSRWQPGTALYTPDGQRHELLPLLTTAAATLDLAVRLGVRQRVPARLLAVRVPQEIADERRRRLRAAARDRGRAVSAARLALCARTVFVTNAPAALLTLREALVLARARWQVELLFKLWKQHLRVDEWRSANPWRILTEVYAKLLAALVQHWLTLIGCWHHPDRSLLHAARGLQAHAPHLAAALDTHPHLCQALRVVARCLAAAARLNPRKTAPSTAQLLLAPDLEPLP